MNIFKRFPVFIYSPYQILANTYRPRACSLHFYEFSRETCKKASTVCRLDSDVINANLPHWLWMVSFNFHVLLWFRKHMTTYHHVWLQSQWSQFVLLLLRTLDSQLMKSLKKVKQKQMVEWWMKMKRRSFNSMCFTKS